MVKIKVNKKKRSSKKKSNNELLRRTNQDSSTIITVDDLPRPEIEPNALVSELKQAQETLLEEGELGYPTITGRKHDDESFLGVLCGPQIYQTGKAFAPDCKWICFTVESWILTAPNAERMYEIYGSVENCPSEYRAEAIMISFESPNESIDVIQLFTRDEEGKPVLGEIRVNSECNHRFYM